MAGAQPGAVAAAGGGSVELAAIGDVVEARGGGFESDPVAEEIALTVAFGEFEEGGALGFEDVDGAGFVAEEFEDDHVEFAIEGNGGGGTGGGLSGAGDGGSGGGWGFVCGEIESGFDKFGHVEQALDEHGLHGDEVAFLAALLVVDGFEAGEGGCGGGGEAPIFGGFGEVLGLSDLGKGKCFDLQFFVRGEFSQIAFDDLAHFIDVGGFMGFLGRGHAIDVQIAALVFDDSAFDADLQEEASEGIIFGGEFFDVDGELGEGDAIATVLRTPEKGAADALEVLQGFFTQPTAGCGYGGKVLEEIAILLDPFSDGFVADPLIDGQGGAKAFFIAFGGIPGFLGRRERAVGHFFHQAGDTGVDLLIGKFLFDRGEGFDGGLGGGGGGGFEGQVAEAFRIGLVDFERFDHVVGGGGEVLADGGAIEFDELDLDAVGPLVAEGVAMALDEGRLDAVFEKDVSVVFELLADGVFGGGVIAAWGEEGGEPFGGAEAGVADLDGGAGIGGHVFELGQGDGDGGDGGVDEFVHGEQIAQGLAEVFFGGAGFREKFLQLFVREAQTGHRVADFEFGGADAIASCFARQEEPVLGAIFFVEHLFEAVLSQADFSEELEFLFGVVDVAIGDGFAVEFSAFISAGVVLAAFAGAHVSDPCHCENHAEEGEDVFTVFTHCACHVW